jgi:hypothetical protein
MTVLSITDETAAGLSQVADSLGISAEELADRAIRRYLREEADKKIVREEEAYRQQHAQLLAQYAGRFIAVHEGQVVDADDDELVLYGRIRERFSMMGVLIKRVTAEVEETWTMRSPRIQ